MGDCFAGLFTAGAQRGVCLRDPVEVIVEWDVLGTELDEEAGLSSREEGDELEEFL